MEFLKGQLPVVGIQYNAASDLPCELNEKSAHFQVDHFLKTGEWLPQKSFEEPLSRSAPIFRSVNAR